MKKYLVIHYSNNWQNSPYVQQFDNLEAAEYYIITFFGDSNWHANDTVIITEVISEHKIEKIAKQLYRFAYKKKED